MDKALRLSILLFLLSTTPLSAQFILPQMMQPAAATGPSFGTVDSWTPFVGQTAGTTLSTGILSAGTLPASSPPCTWSITGTGLKVGATQGGLGGSVTVGGTTYPSSTTTLSLSVPDSGSIATPICSLSTANKTITAFGYVNNNGAVVPTGNTLYDRIVSTDTAGNYMAAQIQNGQWRFSHGGYSWDIETNPSGVTTHSTGLIPAVIGQRYGVATCFNGPSGLMSMYVYVPLASGSLGLVGSITSTYATPPNLALSTIRFGNNEGGVSASPSFVEDFMFQLSSPTCPLVPAPTVTIPTYVAGQSADSTSSTSVSTTYTAANAANSELVFTCTRASTATLSVTSTHNTWTQINAPTAVSAGGVSFRCATYSAFAVGSAADTITATWGASGSNVMMHVVELANVTAVDQHNLGTVTTTTGGVFNSSSVTPTASPEVAVFFGLCLNSCSGGAVTSPITQDPTFGSQAAVQILTTTSAFSGQLTDNGSSSGVNEISALVTVR